MIARNPQWTGQAGNNVQEVVMSNELNRKWDDYAKAAGHSLFAAGLALQRLALSADDEAALDSLSMAVREIQSLAGEMALPYFGELLAAFESLTGQLGTTGTPLDESTLFLLLEAYGGLQAGVETSAVFWRDASAVEVADLLGRLRLAKQSLLQNGAEKCC
jgi:hypothetical protein